MVAPTKLRDTINMLRMRKQTWGAIEYPNHSEEGFKTILSQHEEGNYKTVYSQQQLYEIFNSMRSSIDERKCYHIFYDVGYFMGTTFRSTFSLLVYIPEGCPVKDSFYYSSEGINLGSIHNVTNTVTFKKFSDLTYDNIVGQIKTIKKN